MRRFEGGRLVIATHNQGKLREFAALLAPYAKDVIAAGDLDLKEPIESGVTFAENAILKAHAAAKASGHAALADDSGLCVNALGGKPGIYSARWAPNKDFTQAMKRVNDEIGTNPDRAAYFICVLALAWPGGHSEVVEGRVDGKLIWPPRGSGGHGYDPMFVPIGESRTFAEMDAATKDAISHRGKAVRELVQRYFV